MTSTPKAQKMQTAQMAATNALAVEADLEKVWEQLEGLPDLARKLLRYQSAIGAIMMHHSPVADGKYCESGCDGEYPCHHAEHRGSRDCHSEQLERRTPILSRPKLWARRALSACQPSRRGFGRRQLSWSRQSCAMST